MFFLKHPFLKFSLLIAIGLLIAHFLWSTAITLFIASQYNHRIMNIKKFANPDDWETASSVFLQNVSKTSNQKPIILFVGSSVTFGYSWQEPVIFSQHVQKYLPDTRVANLSMIGAGTSGLTDFLFCPIGTMLKPDVLVVEIPLLNSIPEISPTNPPTTRTCKTRLANGISPLSFTLTKHHGTGWINIAWDEMSYKKPDRSIALTQLPQDYFFSREKFNTIRNAFTAKIEAYIKLAANKGKTVYAFVSPIYTPAIEQLGGDRSAVEEQIALAQGICKKNPNVTCLDASSFHEDSTYYANVSHLNQRGHEAFGEWMARQIAADVGRP